MKRLICLCLVLFLLSTLSGCNNQEEKQPNPTVNFYYCNVSAIQETNTSFVAAEKRTLEGHVNSLEFLIDLYLDGPISTALSTPFPEGLKSESITISNNRVQITLNSRLSELKGIDFTVACVCLAKTAQELAQAEYVYISYENSTSGRRHTVSIGPDAFLDDSTVITNEVDGG